MDHELLVLKEQIARCRRLAASLTDEDMRRSLDELASEYEQRLRRKGAGFMLQDGPDRSRAA